MLHISIKTTSLYGSFVRYLAIELSINCNKKIAEVIFLTLLETYFSVKLCTFVGK